MVSKTYFRYIWLLDLLLERGPMTLESIRKAWEQCTVFDGQLSDRTFHEHRKGVEEMFGVEIACDRSRGNVYYVKNPEVLDENRLAKWMLHKYSIPQGFMTFQGMEKRILLEDIPSGTTYLNKVIDAMQRNVEIVVDYQKFDGEHQCTLHIQPYALKVYNRRWYILGYVKEREAIWHIALDRVMNLIAINKKFELPENFDARKYYSNFTGVYVDENMSLEKVKIRVFGTQVDYLRSLPLHKSQAEVYTKYREYSDFTYRVCITPELITQLLAMGDHVEVLEPESLRETIKEQLQITLNRYGNE